MHVPVVPAGGEGSRRGRLFARGRGPDRWSLVGRIPTGKHDDDLPRTIPIHRCTFSSLSKMALRTCSVRTRFLRADRLPRTAYSREHPSQESVFDLSLPPPIRPLFERRLSSRNFHGLIESSHLCTKEGRKPASAVRQTATHRRRGQAHLSRADPAERSERGHRGNRICGVPVPRKGGWRLQGMPPSDRSCIPTESDHGLCANSKTLDLSTT